MRCRTLLLENFGHPVISTLERFAFSRHIGVPAGKSQSSSKDSGPNASGAGEHDDDGADAGFAAVAVRSSVRERPAFAGASQGDGEGRQKSIPWYQQ